MPGIQKGQPSPYEVKAAVDRLGRAFEEFKAENDAAEIARRTRAGVDTLVEEKVSRLSNDLSRLQPDLHPL